LITERKRLKGRALLLLMEICFRAELFSVTKNNSLGLYFVIFNIPTFISDMLCVYIWYYHYLISISVIIFEACVTSHALSFHIWKFISVSFSVLIFSFCERLLKEEWVLYKSFRRSQNIYLNMVDKLQVPSFVVDNNGRILHLNFYARKIYKEGRKYKTLIKTECSVTGDNTDTKSTQSKERGIFEIIHPDYKKKIADGLKKITKEAVQPINVPILVNPQENFLSSECNLGLDSNLINKGIEEDEDRL